MALVLKPAFKLFRNRYALYKEPHSAGTGTAKLRSFSVQLGYAVYKEKSCGLSGDALLDDLCHVNKLQGYPQRFTRRNTIANKYH